MTLYGIDLPVMRNPSSLTTYRTSVNLKDLDDDGEDFIYSRASGELNKSLEDIVGDLPYDIKLRLRAMGNVYEISGEIHSGMNLPCSRCGREMILPVDEQFNEIIIVMDERPRAGHSGHTGSQFDNGPYCNYVTSHDFSLSDFVHEHIAAAEPYQVHCSRPDCEEVYKKAQISDTSSPKESNPFEVLKNLSVTSKRS